MNQSLPAAVDGLIREELLTECLIFNPETLEAVCLSSEGCAVLSMCQRGWNYAQAVAELTTLGYDQPEELLTGTLERLLEHSLVRSAPEGTTRRAMLGNTAKLVAASVVAFAALPAPAAAVSCVTAANCAALVQDVNPTTKEGTACNFVNGAPCCESSDQVCGFTVVITGQTSTYTRTCIDAAITTPCNSSGLTNGQSCRCF